MSSWYDTWADRYEDCSPSVGADVPFYVGLALEADGPLVELAVGTGRVAIPVAQATRRLVVGIDSSPGCSRRHGCTRPSRESSSTSAKGTYAPSRSTSRRP